MHGTMNVKKSTISHCQVTITITVPSDNYQTGLGPGHRTAKYDDNEVGRAHRLDGRKVHAHTKRTGHRDHHRYKG